ncbi:MAG TPA: hypothetical protein VFC78_02185 [Tepidisphaeraceae bacterium]|nr:hypothetical protein [Tepidisphaeraceae bacterium]
MQLTTQRKVFLAVLALAGAAFGADRCFFSAATASAQPAPAMKAESAAVIGPLAAPAPQVAGLGTLAERLKAYYGHEDAGPLPDAFCPSSAWVGEAPGKPDGAADSRAALTAAFGSHHHLLAVMSGGHRPLAIVDGKVLHAGQLLDGFRLTAIRDRSAVFTADAARVELQLQPKAKAATDDALTIRRSGPGSTWE